eukprot:scaffold15964_cov135-Isochrysis_galbana.AAC.2
MPISSYASDSSAASQPLSHEFSQSINPVPLVGHGSARRSRDICDRARPAGSSLLAYLVDKRDPGETRESIITINHAHAVADSYT